MQRPDEQTPSRAPSTAVVWIAVFACLLTVLRDGPASRRRVEPPRVTKLQLPTGARSDIGWPRFSDPTNITNPLLPISRLAHVVQLGAEGGEKLRVEISLLPETRLVEWEGRQLQTVVTQLVGYRDSAVAEVATDLYAQDDVGAVWHFGEDVANYEGGRMVGHEGTWMAGRDGRPTMGMPAHPQAGDVFRNESHPGTAFEKVTVTSAGQAVDGPRGPVVGALRIEERLVDGTTEEKTFAPGYGELTARGPTGDELYKVAVALPTDGVAEVVPEPLSSIAGDAELILSGGPAGPAVERMTKAWRRYAPQPASDLLVAQTNEAMADLVAAADEGPEAVVQAAMVVAHSGLDLQLLYRAAAQVDRDRLRLWARQLVGDAAAGEADAVAGDAVVLDAVWSRAAAAHAATGAQVEAVLGDLRAASAAGDLATAGATASRLLAL